MSCEYSSLVRCGKCFQMFNPMNKVRVAKMSFTDSPVLMEKLGNLESNVRRQWYKCIGSEQIKKKSSLQPLSMNYQPVITKTF